LSYQQESKPNEVNSFAKYAAEKFQSIHIITAENKPLREPLHYFKSALDKDVSSFLDCCA
jgi:hypothetical protein